MTPVDPNGPNPSVTDDSKSSRPGRTGELSRLSRPLVVVVAITLLTVVPAIVYSTARLRGSEAQRAAIVAERDSIGGLVRVLRDSLVVVEADLRRTVCALSSSTAINTFRERDYALAAELYDDALACDPSDPYVLNLKAYALFKLDDLEGALATQRASVAAVPEYAWGYFDLARFLCAAGELEEAEEQMKTATSLRPELADIAENDGEFRALCRSRSE